jgi:uncharacterized protein
MDLRTRISDAVKTAMKAHQADRVSVLRMVSSAIKNRDIEGRGEHGAEVANDAAILTLLGKMVKQRQESAKAFRDGGRLELAAKEEAEIAVIEEFLPKQMSQAEVETSVMQAIADAGASSIKDMGRVMALLKERHAGLMDFAAVGALVRARLG